MFRNRENTMKMTIRAALCAAAALTCATQASAASYIRYDIRAEGSGVLTTTTAVTAVNTALTAYSFSFVIALNDRDVLTTPVSQTYTGVLSQISTFTGVPTALKTASFLTFDQSGSGPRGTAGGSATINICGISGTTFPTANVAFDPSCSTAQINYSSPGGFSGFSGRVTSLSVQALDDFPGNVGFVSLVPFVPEPSTWALMLAGFGLTAYALRRRKATFSPAL